MDDPWLENSGAVEESEEGIERQLDEATFEPGEMVERRGDFELSEAIEASFNQLVEASDHFTGELLEIDLAAGREETAESLPVGRVSKIDSFTWKLQVAEDEVGDFRDPSLHGEPVVDVPDPGTPNPTGRPIEAVMETVSDDSQEEPGLGWRDISEVASIVLGAAAEDVRQDLEDYQAEQEAMSEAKQKIRDQLGSMDSVEWEDDLASDLPGNIVDQVGLVGVPAVDTSGDSTEPQVRYGEVESEPSDRAEAGTAEEDETDGMPKEDDQESAKDDAQD